MSQVLTLALPNSKRAHHLGGFIQTREFSHHRLWDEVGFRLNTSSALHLFDNGCRDVDAVSPITSNFAEASGLLRLIGAGGHSLVVAKTGQLAGFQLPGFFGNNPASFWGPSSPILDRLKMPCPEPAPSWQIPSEALVSDGKEVNGSEAPQTKAMGSGKWRSPGHVRT